MKVLVIEDEPVVREMLNDMLSDEGYEVTTAQSGEDALNVLEEKKVDYIVSDLMMPGISGVELLYKLRAFKVPIIITSGLSRDVIIEELLAELGISAVLQKPIEEGGLVNALRKARA
jgi:CheY-like chemotaxis protein